MTAMIVLLALPAAAQALTPTVAIQSSGPLTGIFLGNDLGCQVIRAGDTSDEFYPSSSATLGGATNTPGDCGTLLASGGTLYTPDFANHNGSATSLTSTAFTPVSQSTVTGSGTPQSPYQVVTSAQAGASGLTINETDSYVVGDEAYRSDIVVANSGRTAVSAILYHAGDCFQQGSDVGYGFFDSATGAIACTTNPNDTPAGPRQDFVPLTAGAHYVETTYSNVWSDINAQQDFPNTCDCAISEDNAAGLNWDLTVPAGGTQTVSLETNFLATSLAPLTATVAADAAASAPGASNGYTITITNPNSTAVTLSDITDTLPAGFQYVTGSSSGATVSDPAISGQTLTWSGSFSVPAGASTSLHFGVTVASTPGTYTDSAGADGSQLTVTGSGEAAPITVQAAPTVGALTVSPVGTTTATVTAAIDPGGAASTAHLDYGIDQSLRQTRGALYLQATAPQDAGADTATHELSFLLSGLVPNATYHFRLEASNAAGTFDSPDQTLRTRADTTPPPPPVLGRTGNAVPVRGHVFVEPPPGESFGVLRPSIAKGTGFVPLTEVRSIPTGSLIDARAGTLRLITATSAKRRHTQSGTFSGGVFTFEQSRRRVRKGLTTLTLKESAFSGGPSYASCKAGARSHAGSAAASGGGSGPALANPFAQLARNGRHGRHGGRHKAGHKPVSHAVLQTLHARDDHGRFTTRGRYSAGTVRGTIWDTSDRCDGTLTTVRRGTVDVFDFSTRQTIAVHAHHSYLARARGKRLRKHGSRRHKSRGHR